MADFLTTAARIAKKVAPHLTEKQTAKIVEMVGVSGYGRACRDGFGIMAEDESMIERQIGQLIVDQPELGRKVPTVGELVALEDEAHRKANNGVGLDPIQKIEKSRNYAALSDDEKLAKIPASTPVEKAPAAPTVPASAKPAAALSVSDLDELVFLRTGKKPHELSASTRQSMHATLRREHQPDIDQRITQQINAGRPEASLSPEERIRRHREAQQLASARK
jgi:hypothetical protein